MRHLGPRQRQSDQRWDYTCKIDDYVYPIGYCAGWSEEVIETDPELKALILAAIEEKRPFQHKYHTDSHETSHEACLCYRAWLIDHRIRWRTEEGVQRRCDAPDCDKWTHVSSDVNDYLIRLCDEHRTPEIISQVFPIPGRSFAS